MQKKSFITRYSFDDTLKKIESILREKKIARIVKRTIDGNIDEFIKYVSDKGINLIEQDDAMLIFGR